MAQNTCVSEEIAKKSYLNKILIFVDDFNGVPKEFKEQYIFTFLVKNHTKNAVNCKEKFIFIFCLF